MNDALRSAHKDFRDQLVDAGLLIPMGADGMYGRSRAFEMVIERIDQQIAQTMSDHLPAGAREVTFPPLYPREAFERTDYIASFPNLTGSISTFRGDDKAHRALLEDRSAGRPWDAHLSPTDTMLVSAACHPLYGTIPRDIPTDGHTVELAGWCFRHEPSVDPARMQAFRIHELVRIGSEQQASAHRNEWQPRVEQILRDLGLQPRAVPANDPFFGRAGRMLARNQRDDVLKTEMVVSLYGDLDEGTAVASCNEHQTHFGETFELRLPDGKTASSACVGFGLERVALAMLRTHGIDPGSWPEALVPSGWPTTRSS